MTSLHKPIKIFFAWMVFAAVVVTVALVMTGCGDKGDKRSNVGGLYTPGNLPPACPTCPAGTNRLARGIGVNYPTLNIPGIQLGLEFFRTDLTSTPVQSGANIPLAVQGVMFVPANFPPSLGCQFPLGAYAVRTVEGGAGQYDGNMFRNIRVLAEGNGALVWMTMSQGALHNARAEIVACDGQTYPSWFWADVTVDQVQWGSATIPCNSAGPSLVHFSFSDGAPLSCNIQY